MGEVNLSKIPTTLFVFLMKKTDVHELCVIRDSGYIVAVAYIDYGDIASVAVPYGDLNSFVKGDVWGTLPIVDTAGNTTEIPCHYIDITKTKEEADHAVSTD